MAAALLSKAFSSLSLSSTSGPQARQQLLSSSRNGICNCSRIQLPKPQIIMAAVTVTTVGGKLKTRKAAAKRFKVTGTGKVVRRRPGKQHINEKKSSKRLSQLGQERVVSSRDVVHIVDELPYAGIRK